MIVVDCFEISFFVSCVACAGGVSILVMKPEFWKMVCLMRRCGCG